jgi:hypothetical protein
MELRGHHRNAVMASICLVSDSYFGTHSALGSLLLKDCWPPSRKYLCCGGACIVI